MSHNKCDKAIPAPIRKFSLQKQRVKKIIWAGRRLILINYKVRCKYSRQMYKCEITLIPTRSNVYKQGL